GQRQRRRNHSSHRDHGQESRPAGDCRGSGTARAAGSAAAAGLQSLSGLSVQSAFALRRVWRKAAPAGRNPRIKKGVSRRPSCSLALEGRTLFTRADWDALGLGLFRYDTLKLDAQQSVVQRRSLDLDMVGEAERQLEGALGNALVQIGDIVATV